MSEKTYGVPYSEFELSPSLSLRIVFSDRKAAEPKIAAEEAAAHLEAAAAQIRKEAADDAAQLAQAAKAAGAKPSK